MLQFQTIKPDCLGLLKEIMGLKEFEHFMLAGGTALSLRLGHRISIDLDLFTNQLFDIDEFTTFLTSHFKQRLIINGSNRYGVFVSIDSIKVDFLYRYEKFINPYDAFDNIRLASLADIGAMKIHAAANRASKKDYYDLFELLNISTFADLIELHKKMYPNYDLAGTLKVLSNFTEVDMDDDPVSLTNVSWGDIKMRIAEEIQKYVFNIQQKKAEIESERQRSIEEIISKKKHKN